MDTLSQQYDEIVRQHPDEMLNAFSVLKQKMERRDCKFGENLISTFLKPVFLSNEQTTEFKYVIHHIMSILEKVTKLYFSHPGLRDFFYLDKKSHELVSIEHGYEKNIMISRPDAFLVDGSIRFVEFNCDSPAGMGYCDVEEKLFLESFGLEKLKEYYDFKLTERCRSLLDGFLRVYAEFAGEGKRPNIAIVDWDHVRTQNEFRILKTKFMAWGYETIIADPRELKFINGRLECKGFPIDLVYRRVIFRELTEKIDEVQGFIEAYKHGKVCVVNSLRSRLASNKAILSLLTNKRKFNYLFTEEENQVIQKHIPWTRRLMDIQTYWEGNPIFLKQHVITHRNGLVLKPGDSYGGKNVMIGRETEQNVWEELIERIFTNKEDWVVQKYVTIPQMLMPVCENNNVELKTKKFNLNPYVFDGEYAGTVSRFSDNSVINVSAGGGLVPVISYKEKRRNDY